MSREDMKQPEALWLADALDDEFTQGRISNHNGRKAAVELRRLHEVNQDLLKALNTILNICLLDNGHWAKTIEREAHEAIAKATGEKSRARSGSGSAPTGPASTSSRSAFAGLAASTTASALISLPCKPS